MNKLLLSMQDGTEVYENDLVRYYSSDMTKIQFGIAKDYDDFENRLIVSAVIESKINPVSIIELYRESDWKTLDITRERDRVTLISYPFRDPFILTEKKNRENRIVAELPYTASGKTTTAHLFDLGYDGFMNQVNATIKMLINEKIMAFNFDSSFTNGTAYHPKLMVRLPYIGKFKYTMNQLFMVSNKEYLKERIITDITQVIYSKVFKDTNKIDTVIYDGQREYSKIRIPLPYKKTAKAKLSEFIYSPEYAYTKLTTSMREIVNNEVVEFKGNLKTSLPYTTTSTIKFWDYANSPAYAEQSINTEALRIIAEDLVTDVTVNGNTVVNLPYTFRGQYSFKTLSTKGTAYMDGEIRADIRSLINTKLIKKYYYSNGTTKVSGLPWIDKISIHNQDLLDKDLDANGVLGKIVQNLQKIINDNANKYDATLIFPWYVNNQLAMRDLFSSSTLSISEQVKDFIIQIINSKLEAFQYGVIISNQKLTMPFYITGYRLNEIPDTQLRNEILNNFESLLAAINLTYPTIKTYRDTDTTIVGKRLKVEVPIIEHLELLVNESSFTQNIYRCFIANDGELTRAYIIVNNSRFNKDISIASPHIDSENSVVLKTFDFSENPLKYKTDYLEYLVNRNKKDVLNMVSHYAESPYDEGVVYV